MCADRLDYFFRDGLTCGVATAESVARFLDHLAVVDRTIVFTDVAVAREAAAMFRAMNRDWWASPTEAYIYNEFADAIREGFRLGALRKDDLLADDAHVMARLQGAASPLITEKLRRILHFHADTVAGYVPRVVPKNRWLDPPVRVGSAFLRLSEV